LLTLPRDRVKATRGKTEGQRKEPVMAFTATTGLQDEVSRLMSWPVAFVDLYSNMEQIAEALASNEIGAAAVVASGRFVGIITERDLAEHIAGGGNPEHLVGEELATYSPVTLAPTDTVLDATRAMVEAGVRHLPVVEGEEVVGMVSIRDITAVLLRELESR